MAKKVALILFGAFGIVISLALLAGGAALFVAFSPHGWIESGRHRVDTPTRALVSRSADFKSAADALNSLGDFRLRLRAQAVDPRRALFIGVGPTAAVERYVSTFRHDRVTSLEFSPFELGRQPSGGDGVPASPAAQPFWVQRTVGTGSQTLDWKIRNGSYEVVLMNADATPAVDARAVFAVRVPFARTLGIIFLVGTAVFLSVGILLLVIGIRVRPARRPPPPAWPSPGAGTRDSVGTPVDGANVEATP